jgi:hypothetical protein
MWFRKLKLSEWPFLESTLWWVGKTNSIWWAYQTATGTSGSKRIYWSVGRKGNAETANK